MKILLVFPKVENRHPDLRSDKNLFVKVFGEAVSLTLPQVAAVTPPEHTVRIVDENYEPIPIDVEADLIGITCLTMAASRAYELADQFRARGIPVILGGNHPTALPEEAKRHADSVVIGEAESTWPLLLRDFEEGALHPFYRVAGRIAPESIPEPRRDLIRRHYLGDGLLIRRGCPRRCEFCTVTSLYSNDTRTLESVMTEVRHLRSKTVFIYDQNLTASMAYARELLVGLRSLKKRWQANGTIDVLGNDEFLRAAQEAGVYYWFIGFESVSQRSLDLTNKRGNRVDAYPAVLSKLRDHRMIVVGSFMFGFDEDTADIFQKTLHWLNEQSIDMAEFHILTPFPGTALYERLKKEGRIISEDWSLYNTANVVFTPRTMSPHELFEGTRSVAREFYRYHRILWRSLRALRETKRMFVAWSVLFQNVKYRFRYKNQFNF